MNLLKLSDSESESKSESKSELFKMLKRQSKKNNRKTHSKSHCKNKGKSYGKDKNRLSKKPIHKHKHKHKQRGGSSCSLATVQEPGFSISTLGDIPALNISQAKGVIYRPNCQTDRNQAMVPI